jgi:hypothetical protein
MTGKIRKLEKTASRMRDELGIQEGIDITLGENPARVYFIFEDTQNQDHPNYGKPRYLNTTGATMDDVCKVPGGIADRYGLQRDKSNPGYREGIKVALGFRLKSAQDKTRRHK